MLRLDDGESGQLTTPLTTQNLAYQGAPNEATSAPDYNTLVFPSVIHTIGNTDSLTQAIATLGYTFTDRINGDSIYGTLTWQAGSAATFASGSSVTFQNGCQPAFQQAIGSPPFTVVSTTLVGNLNADLHDGYQAGNATGNIPVSNGVLNTNLNSQYLGSLLESAFSLIDGTRAFTGKVRGIATVAPDNA